MQHNHLTHGLARRARQAASAESEVAPRAGIGRWAVAAGALATALGLAACGSTPSGSSSSFSSESPQQILKAAADALKSSTSFQANGSGTSGTETLDLSMSVFRNGDISGQESNHGQVIKLLTVGGKVYLNGTATAWEALGVPASAATLLSGKWAVVPASDSINLVAYTKMEQQLTAPGKVTYKRLGTSTINGEKVVGVSYTSPHVGTITFYVADSGTPYLVRLDQRTSGGSSTMTISDWNQQSAPSAPTDTMVVPGA
jgi:hypothetical protein